MDPRTEFGYTRTPDCSCRNCVKNCEHLSGYLVPADIERMREALGQSDVGSLAANYLAASPGAVVAKRGRLVRLPTLVPRREAIGRCVFLDQQDRCSIHAASPFGCAFFNAHQSSEESDERSGHGLVAIMKAWRDRTEYSKLWISLAESGQIVPAPSEARNRMQQALEQEKSDGTL